MAGPSLNVEVEWSPFMLRPNEPEAGTPKPGGPGPHQVGDRLRQVGQAAGINFTGLCPRAPNTTKAHALLTLALEVSKDMQNQVQEILFRQYFTDGKYPDVDNLVAAAEEAGLSGTEVRAALQDRRYEETVKREAAQASHAGISGVPFFFFNGKPGFSGALPAEQVLEALQSA